ncbi:MAG: amidohydrolase [Marinilabiliaceae bacterium]|jgi:predicted amidohydrolase|nr:amidohydrolase [Marinilabiliaceae bacterium]
MRITIVQADLVWENADANLDHFHELLKNHGSETDLVVLPEMFNTGFTMNAAGVAEKMNGKTVKWMQDFASAEGIAITGSLIIEENKRYYNRMVFAAPGAVLYHYDKSHLFRMEKETSYFEKGSRQVIVPYMGFNINLQICYDLRFPVWSRNVANSYDLMINVASWPAARRKVWSALLTARAIENQCYHVGVNRVGTDGEGISYTGDSQIIGPKGDILLETTASKEEVVTAEISLEYLQAFRKKFPVWQDADSFRLMP